MLEIPVFLFFMSIPKRVQVLRGMQQTHSPSCCVRTTTHGNRCQNQRDLYRSRTHTYTHIHSHTHVPNAGAAYSWNRSGQSSSSSSALASSQPCSNNASAPSSSSSSPCSLCRRLISPLVVLDEGNRISEMSTLGHNNAGDQSQEGMERQ